MPRHTPIYSRLQQQARVLKSTNTGEVLRRPGRMLRWIVILALLGLLFFGIQNAYSALAGSDLFRLEQISVVGNGLLTPSEVVACSGLNVGGNLFEADLVEATRRLASHPLVRETLLLRQPPGTLVISLEERRPIALVAKSEGLVGLDREGMLFALPQVGLDLPVVTSVKAVRDSAGALQLMGLVHFLETLRTDAPAFLNGISEIQLVSAKEARVYLAESGLEVRMRLDAAVQQARNFEAYLVARQTASPAYVDLRFNGQVVVGRM